MESKTTARIVINYCLDNDIGILVVGSNEIFQKDSYISKSKNQSFVDIPYDILQDKLEYLCKSNGILLVIPEKSYTS
ncbi:IS200/IS605 family accessory protein TnpB-related protein [Catenibacterium sp.]|uniref:IS200/IS605 family accessory protein TnpB-related protein n=1 Tax=Catenibacterium sp. TaxID=2049022 RepID=UPI003FA484DB